MPSSTENSALARLSQPEDEAALALFLDVCRYSGQLRAWLFHEFARNAETRSRLAKLLDRPPAALETPSSPAELSGELAGWRRERDRLRRLAPEAATHGGLMVHEVEGLILRYQAGMVDPASFHLAAVWQSKGERAKTSPQAIRAAAEFMDDVLHHGRVDRLRHLQRAAEFVGDRPDVRTRRARYGHAVYWKLCVLLHILRHPRSAYRTRELRAHLAERGLQVTTLDIRRFCRRHSIQRDITPGRPRIEKSRSLPPGTRS